MNNNSFDIDKIIIDYLTNDISDEDLVTLNVWRQQSISNEEEFVQMKNVWEKSQSLHLFDQIDVKADWEKVQKRMVPEEAKVISMHPVSKRNVFAIRKIAVAVVPLFVISISLFLYWNIPGFGRYVMVKSGDATKNVVLPDQSEVVVNKNSKLVYLRNIANSAERNVNVEGEVFFHVKHNDTPFKVHVKDAVVEVMGTEFDVDESSDDLVVSVVSGKVKVSSDKTSVDLIKGERAVVSDKGLKEEKTFDANELYWKSKELNFQQATLEEICKVLNDSFDEIDNVVFKCKKDDVKVTTSFKNQSLKDILDELTIHFNKKMVLNNKTLTISD